MPIHLPLFQHYDCDGCGYCCRHLVVNVTEADRNRIVAAGSAKRPGGPDAFVSYRFRRRRLWRLAHKPGGGCVFLAEDGRCRLHAESGFDTKPLACRLYPFMPTPGADSVRLDLRSDCPAVARNHGRSLTVHEAVITDLAREIGAQPMAAPPQWRSQRSLRASEFISVVRAFETILRKTSWPIRARLRAGCGLLDTLYELNIQKVQDDRFVELIDMLAAAVAGEEPTDVSEAGLVPRRVGKLFCQWLFLHAVTDDSKALQTGVITRILRSQVRYWQARRFVAQRGPVPAIDADWPTADFEAVMRVQPGPDEASEPIVRSMRLKLDAHAFAGAAYFGYDLISGLTALWLMPALVGWFSRLEAISAGRDILTADDILAGCRRTHHTFGVSPVFAHISERFRLRGLARPGAVVAILGRYGP